MIEIPIKFKNFDGKEVTETWNFHLSYPEIAELETMYPEGFVEHFRDLIRDEKNMNSIFEFLKLLMMKSVGRRVGENGRRFLKDDDTRADFDQSGAYSALFIMLATGELLPENFFNGIMPHDLHEKANAMKKSLTSEKVEGILDNLDEAGRKRFESVMAADDTSKPREKKLEEFTHAELLEMSSEEFAALSRKHKNNLPQNFLVAGMQRLTRDNV